MGFLKNKNSILQISGVILFISLFFYLRYTLSPNENFYSRMLDREKEGHYSGIVLNKYIDFSEHSTPKLVLSKVSISIINKFYDKISIGDSVVKNEGEYFLTVFKPDNTHIKLDYKKYYDQLSGNYIEANPYPVQMGLVNDYEGTFNKEQDNELDSLLSEFDSVSQNKIVFLSVKSYDESISFQDYVSDLAKRWHIDQNNKGRTILIVFTKEKRKITLTSGAAVKGFSEAQANEIMSEKVIPEFKKNQYYAGVKNFIVEITHQWK